jgi:hypothetical protein
MSKISPFSIALTSGISTSPFLATTGRLMANRTDTDPVAKVTGKVDWRGSLGPMIVLLKAALIT